MDKLNVNADVNRVLLNPEVKERFATLGAESSPMAVDQFAAFLRTEVVRFAKAISDSGATAE